MAQVQFLPLRFLTPDTLRGRWLARVADAILSGISLARSRSRRLEMPCIHISSDYKFPVLFSAEYRMQKEPQRLPVQSTNGCVEQNVQHSQQASSETQGLPHPLSRLAEILCRSRKEEEELSWLFSNYPMANKLVYYAAALEMGIPYP